MLMCCLVDLVPCLVGLSQLSGDWLAYLKATFKMVKERMLGIYAMSACCEADGKVHCIACNSRFLFSLVSVFVCLVCFVALVNKLPQTEVWLQGL